MEEIIKLLLVEDDANLCYIIQGGLEDMIGGYKVLTASNGEEGLAVWKAQQPDVIVADIEMPVMDGYEMVRRIREQDEHVPILFTSGRVSQKAISGRGTACTYHGTVETDARDVGAERSPGGTHRETVFL